MNRRWLAIPALALGATVLPIAVESVSAHSNRISGVSTCQQDGTYTVTWKIEDDLDIEETVTVSATGGGTVTPTTATITPVTGEFFKSITATHVGIPGTATSVTLSVHGDWIDGEKTDDSASVALAGDCVQPKVQPVAPIFHEGDCTAAPSMEIPPETPDYAVTVAGTAGFGNTVTVTFTPKGSVLLLEPTVFTHTFGPQPEGCGEATTTTTIEKTLTFQVLGPICVADHPYIHWTLAATGLEPSQNLATLTFSDVNGNVVQTLTNQPFEGQALWPGASLDPEDWPGWVKIGGVWFTDPSDAVLRQGLFVRADVNPTAGPLFVPYPEATAACSQPEDVEVTTTLSGTLPVTGSSTGGTVWIAGLFVGLGGLVVLGARRRRSV